MHNRVYLVAWVCCGLIAGFRQTGWCQDSNLHRPLRADAVEKTVVIQAGQQVIAFADSFVIASSDSIVARQGPLVRGRDYSIDYRRAEVTLLRDAVTAGDTLRIFYRRLQLPLKRQYSNRSIRAMPDTAQAVAGGTPGIPVSTAKTEFSRSTNYGANLRKSGSLVRGVSIGTGQGLKVDSGLQLQVSGKVAEGVEVVAALSDQNTPIQPEGNTQTLQEIDKVFIQINAQKFSATLGNYQLAFRGTEFARYQRKLQGAMGQYNAGNAHLTLFGAVSKGKYRTQQFMGIEGNQGPYQLTGDRGQIDIIVLAGTERVWIDGEVMVRGENNDYVIEYGNGQITFTRQRLITGDSRITVDFQYSDEQFQRSLFGLEGIASAWQQKLNIRTTFLREGDDKNNPLQFTITDEFLRIMEEAGDSLAVISGAIFVGEGKGTYAMQDSIFLFVGPDSGDYVVRFSDVGEGRGSYKYVSFGNYQYVGEGLERYLPVLILPKAKRHDVADVRLDFKPGSAVNLISEFSLSRFDQNLYSNRDDDNNGGGAYLFELQLAPERLRLGGKNFGKAQLGLRLRHRGETYRDIDRVDQVEYGRYWDLGTDFSINDETVSEANLRYEPTAAMEVYGSAGALRAEKGSIASSRWEFGARSRRKEWVELDYRIENIVRRNPEDLAANTWLRQRGRVERLFWHLRPLFEIESELKKEPAQDSLNTGFRFMRLTGGLGLENWHRLSAQVLFSQRDDDDRVGAAFRTASEARTAEYRLALQNWHNLVFSASYIQRRRDYADTLKQDTRTDLAEVRLGYQNWNRMLQTDAYYQITNTQVNRMQRVYIKVGEGNGNYRFDEELNEYVQDPFGDYILRLVPTDNFIPVVELRSRWQLRLRPEYYFRKRKGLSGWQKAMSALSSETLVRIEEKTRDPDVRQIYLLNFKHFQNPEFTLFGFMSLRQDIYLFQNRRNFSLRYRFFASRSLNNQFLAGAQDQRRLQHELRMNLAFSKKLRSQIEMIRSTEDKTFEQADRQDRFVRGWRFQQDLSYRPQPRLELALRAILGRDEDGAFSPATKVTQLTLKPRTTYSFLGKGRFRGELEWTHVSASPDDRVIPFEMAQGNRPGNTFRWNITFEYRVSNNLNASLSYLGRDEPDRPKTQHIAKAEMRAFF